MGFWRRLKEKVKTWFRGGNSGGGSNVRVNNTVRSLPRISSGGQYSFNRRELLNSLRGGDRGSGASSTNGTGGTKQESISDSFKASESTFKHIAKPESSPYKRMAESSDKTKAELRAKLKKLETERKEFHKATGNKYNTKTGDEEHDRKAYALRHGGYGSASPEVQKHSVKYHPTITTAARAISSGVTGGATELAISKLSNKDKERAEAEKYYQKHKDKTAETIGEIAGSLVFFGGTAGATDRLGEKLIEKTAPKAAERLAEKQIIKNAAKKSVAKAVKKGTVKEASEELVRQVGKDKAKKIVSALGNDVAQNLTTSALYDINKASAKHEVGSEDWWKELLGNAVLNAGITGAIAGGSVLTGNKRLVKGAAETVAKNTARRTAARARGKALGEEAVAERLAKARANKVASKKTSGSIFGRAAAKEAELDRALLNGDAYGDIGKGVLPPSEIEIRGTRDIDSPLRNAAYGREKAIKNAERVESLSATRERLLRNAGIDAPQEGKAKLGDLVTVRNKDEVRIANINKELDEVSDAISRARNIAPKEEYEALLNRFDELMAERNALEARRKTPKPTEESVSRIDESSPKSELPKAKESDALAEYEESRKRGYTVEITNDKGKKRKVTIEAKSEAEALDIASKRKNAKTVKITEPAKPRPPKLTDEEKRARMISEADEKADAIRAALAGEEPAAQTSGAKPAAEKLKVKTETKAGAKAPSAKPTVASSEPKNVEELGSVIGKKREKKSAKDKVKEFVGTLKTKLVNSLDSFEQENKQYLKSDPERWDRNNAAIDKTRRHQAIAGRSIEEHQLGWNGRRIEGAKSLKGIYAGLDEAKENLFERYLLLMHAPDRIREGKPIFKGAFEDAEVCSKEAQKILESNPDFADRANDLYRYIRNELQNRVDAGLLPQEVADDWFERYPNYVPTGRVGNFSPDEDIWELAQNLARGGNTVGASKIKAATGSDLDIRSIKEQIAEATTRNWRDMSMNNLFRQMFGDRIADELATEADGGIEEVLEHTINLGKTKDGGKYYADVFIDGKEHRVEIEKRFYEGMKDLFKNGRFGNGIDVLTDAASKLSTPFKKVVTSWNPIFMVKNGERDFPEAIINSRQTKEFMECMGVAKNDLFNNGQYTQALRDSGVSQANLVNLEEALVKEREGLIGKVGDAANKFATLQESVETYPRLVEFMATIKKLNGGTLPDSLENVPMEWLDIAAANAADVTVNFGRSGSVGKMLNRGIVPFFNPSIQGFDKFLRNFSEQKSTKALLSTLAKATALGAGVTTLNNYMLDDNPNYQQISARDKATNIIIPVPIKLENGRVSAVGTDDANIFIKIPKSRFAAAYSIPTVNISNDNKMGWAEMIKVAGDQVAPVDPIESSIFAPFVLASRNQTWYGKPIVPDSMTDLPPSEQYDANTSNIGKALGKMTERLPKELQISPKKADYIIDSTTGVFGDFILPMATPSRQGGGNAFNKYVAHPAGNVLKRNFFIDSVTQNDLSTRFYDALHDANTNNKSKFGGKAEADEYKRLNEYSTEASKIGQAIKHLQGGDSQTKQKDIYELQKVKNQLMQDALDGKSAPTSAKTMDAVQKYVGTTYAVDNFGSSADKKAMKLYGAARYGELSDKEMQKAIDSDKEFYNGVKSIGNLDSKMEKAGIKSNTVLSKAVALASVNANDDLFGAYRATKQSRTETDNKMNRARAYFNSGGSEDEYVQLETARKTLGKLTDFNEDAEIEKAEKQLAKGEISLAEYHDKEDSIKYNANISYIGLATSLAQANAPERGYRLYDIKDKNIQKGINLAAMGFTARDYREMAKALDTDGNGYPSAKEIREYVANSNVEDKATLYDALYYYKGTYNPFGTPTNYSRAQAAKAGAANGVKAISGESGDFKLSSETSKGGYSGYYRRGYRKSGYRHYSRGGGSRKSSVPALKQSNYKASNETYKSIASTLTPRTTSTKKTTSRAKIEPPKVKFKEYEV